MGVLFYAAGREITYWDFNRRLALSNLIDRSVKSDGASVRKKSSKYAGWHPILEFPQG
jgi:hypothetical protein